ncbi:MAG TPA: hypothetical protein VGK24_14865 [Candidatus Angelobacter sp.]|jgi:hypothetical protein
MKNLLAFVAGGLLVLLPVCLLFIGFYIHDVYKDRQQHVLINGSIPLFPASEGGRQLCSHTDRNKVATITPGEEVNIRRIIYEKDCMTVKIRRKSGQEGYIVSGTGEWRIQ